jgi:hypothetical protein
MRRLTFFYFCSILLFSAALLEVHAQYLQQDFSLPLVSGNENSGMRISNTGVLVDTNYVSNTAPTNQKFTYLSTNNAAAFIEMTGDGVMRLSRAGSGTVYVVRNVNFDGPPAALKVSFDFNAETTGGTSNSAIEVMVGQSFPNSNSAPSSGNKFSSFYIQLKSPTGTPGNWTVGATSSASPSSYNTVQKVTWVMNKSGVEKVYTAPNGSTDTVGNNQYDLWVGNNREVNDQAVTTPAAEIQNFEIRISGGNGTYAVDNLLIEDIPLLGTLPTVTTDAITNIAQTTATGGGNVTDAGTAAVTARGICWSTSENPTTSDSKTEDGNGLGTFVSSITGLTAGTTYYVRAYATSSVGTAYGDQVTFSSLPGLPDITLASDNPAVPAGDMGLGTPKNTIYKFSLAVATAPTQLNQVNFTTAGTYTETDIAKFQLWYNTTDQLSSALQIGTDITATLGTGLHSFASLTQDIGVGATGYLWITTDISLTAASGKTLSVNALTTDDVTFTAGNKTGSAFAGGVQTIVGGTLPTEHFRTVGNGAWNSAATWEASPDGTVWTAATLSPDSTSASIHVRTGDTVTVTESVIVDNAVVDSGAVVTVDGSPVLFTVANGADAVDMLVNGTLKVTGTAIASPGPYSVSLSTDAVLKFGATGVYQHDQNQGAIPVSVWEDGSTFMLTGVVSGSPANGNQNFYNVIWNAPAQTSSLNLGWNGITIRGDITVVNTNTGRWQFCAPTTGNSSTVDILGDVTLLAGNLTTNGTSNGNTTIVINHYGDINVTGGNFAISRGSQGGTGTSTWYLHDGNFTISNATTQNSNPTGAKFLFSGTTPQELNVTNLTYGGGGFPIVVDTGATVNLGSSVVAGNGQFTVLSDGGIITSMPNGFNDNITTTGTITLSSEGNYGYNGTAAQVTGSLIPAVVNDLDIDNPLGVTLDNSITVNGNLTLTVGYLELNGKDITLGPDGMLIESLNSVVRGNNGKIVAVKDLNAPASVNVGGLGAMLTSAGNLGVTTVERYHSPRSGNSNFGIARYYKIAPANNTGLNATLRFYYDPSELASIPEANLVLFKSLTGEPNTWNQAGGVVNANDNYVELSGINDFSYWTIADVANPIPVELTSFNVSVGNQKASISWTTATETNNMGFEVERSKAAEENSSWTKIGFVKGNGNSTEISSYSFRDNDRLIGKYSYRLKQIDYDGSFAYSNQVEVDFGAGPEEFGISQNYPNPFNPTTTIEFQVPMESEVVVTLYDMLGKEVSTLLREVKPAGYHTLTLNAVNLSTGVYYYRMTAGDFSQVKKMIVIK